jgi:hypothetical protein
LVQIGWLLVLLYGSFEEWGQACKWYKEEEGVWGNGVPKKKKGRNARGRACSRRRGGMASFVVLCSFFFTSASKRYKIQLH